MASDELESDGLAASLQWLAAVRAGSPEALGPLLQQFRRYLLVVAHEELGEDLRGKIGSSDLVQDAFLQAQQIFERFTGDSPEELRLWLRAILRNKVADCKRQFQEAEKRQINRERSLERGPSRDALVDDASSPSAQLARREDLEALLQSLERLPEHYRQVLRWRYWEDLSFPEIGQRLGCSPDAARMLWMRAAERLQQEMGPAP